MSGYSHEEFSGRVLHHVGHVWSQLVVQGIPLLISEGEEKPTPAKLCKQGEDIAEILLSTFRLTTHAKLRHKNATGRNLVLLLPAEHCALQQVTEEVGIDFNSFLRMVHPPRHGARVGRSELRKPAM